MRRAVFIATSLDGFIARSDGSIDWLDRAALAGEDYGHAAFYAGVDVVVMGRGTWETALGFPVWPYEGKRVVVVTHRPTAAPHGEELFAGDVSQLDEQLGDARCWIDGGQLIRQFLARALIDELTISLVPVLLGSGRPLFANDPDAPEQSLSLVDTRAWPTSGLVQLRYRRT